MDGKKVGKVIRTGVIVLPEGSIVDMEDRCKDLGIPQANGTHEEAYRNATTAKFLQRENQVK